MRLWLIGQIVVCAIVAVVTMWPLEGSGLAFFILGSALFSAVQVGLTSALLWRLRSNRKQASMIVGAVIGCLTPVALFFLFSTLSKASDWFNAVPWVILASAGPSVVGGLSGGAWLGYIRWQSLEPGRERRQRGF